MDLRDLEVFRAVVNEGSITQAAEKLGRVQSSVTVRIQRLEDDLGVPLFVRQGRRLTPAPAATPLMDYADRLLALADEARSTVSDQTPRGPFNIGSIRSAAAIHLPVPIAQFMLKYPEVGVQLHTAEGTDVAAGLKDGSLDAAFVMKYDLEAGYVWERMFVDRMLFISPPGSDPVTLGTPIETLILFVNRGPHKMMVDLMTTESGQRPRQILQMGSYHAVLETVRAGLGAGIMLESFLSTFGRAQTVRADPIESEWAQITTCLAWRDGMMNPKIAALLEVFEGFRTPD